MFDQIQPHPQPQHHLLGKRRCLHDDDSKKRFREWRKRQADPPDCTLQGKRMRLNPSTVREILEKVRQSFATCVACSCTAFVRSNDEPCAELRIDVTPRYAQQTQTPINALVRVHKGGQLIFEHVFFWGQSIDPSQAISYVRSCTVGPHESYVS